MLETLLRPVVIIPVVAAILLILLLIAGYLKAPPDTAYIISGLGKRRILIGKAGWRVPFFERVDKISLRVMQVDVKTSEAVPTNEFINVSVDGVANVKVSSDPTLLLRASEALLGMNRAELVSLVTQVLEGNMREIVGSVGLKEMVQERQIVAENQLTCLMVTHNMQDALDMGNRTIMMDSGRIIYDVRGEERSQLTVADLLRKFKENAGAALDNDRMLLS